MIILSINAGSSSLKFTGFDMPSEKFLSAEYLKELELMVVFILLKLMEKK